MRLLSLSVLVVLASACGGSSSEKPTTGDDPKARLADQKACDTEVSPSPDACARMCERGVEASCQRLVNLCLGGDADGCMVLAAAYEREGDATHATGAYRLACQLGQAKACDKLGGNAETAPPPAPH